MELIETPIILLLLDSVDATIEEGSAMKHFKTSDNKVMDILNNNEKKQFG